MLSDVIPVARFVGIPESPEKPRLLVNKIQRQTKMKPMQFLLILIIALSIMACGKTTSENYGNFSREELRYYAYAPPLIPHKVINRKCLDCHLEGLVVEGYKAPVTPHPQLVNCQQCHIYPDRNIRLFKRNSFAGMLEPKAFNLPQPAGPPLIPHR